MRRTMPIEEALAELFRALGYPTRVRLLEMLREGERCGCDLWPELDEEQSTVSRHLKRLERAGILASRREGVRVMYSVADPRVLELLDLARRFVGA